MSFNVQLPHPLLGTLVGELLTSKSPEALFPLREMPLEV